MASFSCKAFLSLKKMFSIRSIVHVAAKIPEIFQKSQIQITDKSITLLRLVIRITDKSITFIRLVTTTFNKKVTSNFVILLQCFYEGVSNYLLLFEITFSPSISKTKNVFQTLMADFERWNSRLLRDVITHKIFLSCHCYFLPYQHNTL